MERKKRDIATRAEVVAIHRRLEGLLTIEDGKCFYAPGFSDQAIADELKVSVSSVQGIRTELFGKLRPAAGGEAADPRVDDLVRLVHNLIKSNTDLRDRHNRLISTLALNRVIDCKHLTVPPDVA